MESALMTSALMSSQSAVGFQRMRKEVKKMERHRVEESADGLVVDDVIGDVIIFSRWFERPVARISSRLGSQAQRIKEVAKRSSRSDKPVAKQLTTHEEFTKAGCQLLSSIQMVKTTRSLQKKRTQVLFSCRYFTEERCTKMERIPVQARRRKTHVYVVSHTVEAVVHLWSLGVLTAAGCGIGSVHAVVRSNLLVEPSEVEEGEM
ncbi:hypothetical protein F511_27998 [Dorcoceras hygrometricum]|uniref:Uncharacterized protein n=1 Tax=Dorcoceras hygrometricum TaxID=472368 RepID=A0A2Z7C3E7_9LAMI|nr:hypothetical protein F511_27998 [Dorcoceras hygrometricum]